MSSRSPFLEGALEWVQGDADAVSCPTCGYAWTSPPEEARDVIRAAPARYAAIVEGHDAAADAPSGWSATSYIWHLADLARGWSERWVVLADSPGALLAGWDPDELAAARNYAGMPTVSALWALSEGVARLLELTDDLDDATTFMHGDWGEGTVADATVWLGHEFRHHELDVTARLRPDPADGS